jgi:hypothetical protein
MKHSAKLNYTSCNHGTRALKSWCINGLLKNIIILHLKKGTHMIRVRAVRYGYKESNELKGNFIVK